MFDRLLAKAAAPMCFNKASMLNGLCKVCRTPRSFAAPKVFSVSGAPEMAITFTLRKARVSSRIMSSPFISGMSMSVMTKSVDLWRYSSSPMRLLAASVTSYPAPSRVVRRSARMGSPTEGRFWAGVVGSCGPSGLDAGGLPSGTLGRCRRTRTSGLRHCRSKLAWAHLGYATAR
jgi:hypothetical protein